MRRTLIALAAGGALAALSMSWPAAAETFVLGEIAELTGAAETIGGPQHNGIKLAVDEINAAGGLDIGGAKVGIDLRTEDTKSDPTTGVTVVQKLLNRDGASLLVGSLSGAVAGAYMPIIQNREDVINVIVGAGNAGLNEFISVYRPRADGSQSINAEVVYALKTAKEQGKTSIAILFDKKLQTNATAVPQIEKAIKDAGIEVTGPMEFELGATQFSSQIAALKRAGTEIALFQGYPSDMLTFVKQARAQGYAGTVVAASGATAGHVERADVSDEDLKNVFDIGTPFPSDLVALNKNAAAAQKFADAYQKKFGAPPGYTSASAYGGVYILARALEKAGTTTDHAKIREALDALKIEEVPELAELMIAQDGGRIFRNHQAYFALVLREWDGQAWKTISAIE